MGAALTYGTARLAMALYLLGLAVRWYPRTCRFTRPIWTAGCVVFLVHVACAFQFVHHWSHADAYAATARRTQELTGWDWGGGLYLNYAFTLVWAGDVCWSWLAARSHAVRPRAIVWATHGFMGFMAFNAAVVFAETAMFWSSLVGCVLLAAIWMLAPAQTADSWRAEPGEPRPE